METSKGLFKVRETFNRRDIAKRLRRFITWKFAQIY